tara:strand:- start:265019 stop:265462 length:444 start_codon:yes stop_codon:yes gene_type:complete
MTQLIANTVDGIVRSGLSSLSFIRPGSVLHTPIPPGMVSNVLCNGIINLDPGVESFYLYIVDSDESVIADLIGVEREGLEFISSPVQYDSATDPFSINDMHGESLVIQEVNSGDYVLFFWNEMGHGDNAVYYIIIPAGSLMAKSFLK